jgi:excisionase family DNA binding protein
LTQELQWIMDCYMALQSFRLTTGDVVELLGCSRPTILRLVRDGKLRALRAATKLRFSETDVQKFIDAHLTGGADAQRETTPNTSDEDGGSRPKPNARRSKKARRAGTPGNELAHEEADQGAAEAAANGAASGG